MDVVPWFLVLALIGWFWWDSAGAREVALRTAFDTCRDESLQLLDHTVSREKLRLRRDQGGSLRLWRCYSFEFTSDGARRNLGWITLLGKTVETVHLDPHRVPPVRPGLRWPW